MKPLLSLVFILLMVPCSFSEDGKQGNDYPVPKRDKKLLFYVQRTHNRNTIIYELNLNSNGKPDKEDPLVPSWIRYEEGGERKELSYIQNRVYGLDFTQISTDQWKVQFRSYSKKDIFLVYVKDKDEYRVLTTINGKMAELTSLFVASVTNSLGIPSSVKYIDIKGIDPATGKNVVERIIP